MTTVLDRARTAAATDARDLYFQCALAKGRARTTGWIEQRGAKVGARVELKGSTGLWTVLAVHKPGRNGSWLRDKQVKDRGSLKSIK